MITMPTNITTTQTTKTQIATKISIGIVIVAAITAGISFGLALFPITTMQSTTNTTKNPPVDSTTSFGYPFPNLVVNGQAYTVSLVKSPASSSPCKIDYQSLGQQIAENPPTVLEKDRKIYLRYYTDEHGNPYCRGICDNRDPFCCEIDTVPAQQNISSIPPSSSLPVSGTTPLTVDGKQYQLTMDNPTSTATSCTVNRQEIEDAIRGGNLPIVDDNRRVRLQMWVDWNPKTHLTEIQCSGPCTSGLCCSFIVIVNPWPPAN
jgi:hypothetical protein